MSFWKKKKKKVPTSTSQFWAGHFADEALFRDFTKEIWDDVDEPISQFAISQGESFYDHDWFEVSFNADQTATGIKFAGASWVEKWMDEFDLRVSESGLEDVNCFISMIILDEGPRGMYRQIKSPVSVSGEGFNLKFLGEIEHELYGNAFGS